MQSFLMINSLFKTIEYHLVAPSSLKITELANSGEQHSKTYSLSNVSFEEGQTAPSFLPWLVASIGVASIATVIYFSKSSELLSNNLLSSISLLVCVFGALAFLSKPTKNLVYRDSFSNSVLFKLDEHQTQNNITKKFMTDLNTAIEDAKDSESELVNLKSNARLQFEQHNKNVDDLLNSGLIDEVLYKRICKSMKENVFGKPQTHAIDNVVYLNR